MSKRKLSRAEKAAKAKRRQEYETIFINGKMKRVRRPPTIEDMDVDDFVRQNADCRAIKSPARLISIAAAPGASFLRANGSRNTDEASQHRVLD